jgi:hypothetical protein
MDRSPCATVTRARSRQNGAERARWLPPIEDASALDRLFSQDPEEDGRWTLRITGEPAYLQSAFINGIKRMPCAWD